MSMPSDERNNKGCGCHLGSSISSRSLSGLSKTSRTLALITALSVAATLLYVFVLLVPAWRIVHVDTEEISSQLANSSNSNEEISRQREALAKDPLLRNRTANAFRECLQLHARVQKRHQRNSTTRQEMTEQQNHQQQNKSDTQQLINHMLEILAGSINATTETGRNQSAQVQKQVGESPSSDHCWFIDLRWSSGSPPVASETAGRHYLDCIRALFLLAVGILLCHCLCLTGTLYSCFASRLPRPCLVVLLAAHCLTLSQLVAAAILQDASVGLESRRLQQLLDSAGFPPASVDAVTVSRGNWCLAFLCLLCFFSGAQMLLLLLLAPFHKSGIYTPCQHHHHSQHHQAGAAAEQSDKTAECDATEDTNPLI